MILLVRDLDQATMQSVMALPEAELAEGQVGGYVPWDGGCGHQPHGAFFSS